MPSNRTPTAGELSAKSNDKIIDLLENTQAKVEEAKGVVQKQLELALGEAMQVYEATEELIEEMSPAVATMIEANLEETLQKIAKNVPDIQAVLDWYKDDLSKGLKPKSLAEEYREFVALSSDAFVGTEIYLVEHAAMTYIHDNEPLLAPTIARLRPNEVLERVLVENDLTRKLVVTNETRKAIREILDKGLETLEEYDDNPVIMGAVTTVREHYNLPTITARQKEWQETQEKLKDATVAGISQRVDYSPEIARVRDLEQIHAEKEAKRQDMQKILTRGHLDLYNQTAEVRGKNKVENVDSLEESFAKAVRKWPIVGEWVRTLDQKVIKEKYKPLVDELMEIDEQLIVARAALKEARQKEAHAMHVARVKAMEVQEALKTGGPKDASGGLKNALKEQSRIAEDLKQEHAVVLYSMADHAKYGLTPPETKVQERFLPHEVTKAFEAKEYKTVLRERDNIREPDRAARQARVQEIERKHERERADSIATLSAHWETSVVLAEISGVNIDMAVLQESIVEGMYATEYTEAQLDDVFGTKRENAQIQAKHQEYIKVIRHDIGLANDARLSRDVTENVDVYIAAVTYLRQIQKRLKVKNPAHLYPYAIAFIGGVTTTANKEDAGRLLSLLTIDLLSELPGNTQPDGLFGNQLIPVDVNGFTRVVVASEELMHNPKKMRPQEAAEVVKMDDIAIGVIKTIKGAYRRRNPRDPDYLNPVLELPSEPTYQEIERRSRETV